MLWLWHVRLQMAADVKNHSVYLCVCTQSMPNASWDYPYAADSALRAHRMHTVAVLAHNLYEFVKLADLSGQAGGQLI